MKGPFCQCCRSFRTFTSSTGRAAAHTVAPGRRQADGMTRRSFDLEVVAEIAAAQGGFVLARQLAEL